MTITFQYSPQILQKAHELHFKKFFPLQGRLPLILGFMSVWTGLLLLLILGKDGNKLLTLSFIFFGVISIGLYYWMVKSLGKRVYKKLTDYHDPIVLHIGDEVVEMVIRNDTYEMPWKEIRKALITPDLILLYPTDRMFYIFPKKNFKEGEFVDFEKMVKEKVAMLH